MGTTHPSTQLRSAQQNERNRKNSICPEFVGRRSLTIACPLFLILAPLWGCDRKPGIIVNIAAWLDGVDRIRVQTSIEGTAGMDIFLNKDQIRFAVQPPAGSQARCS